MPTSAPVRPLDKNPREDQFLSMSRRSPEDFGVPLALQPKHAVMRLVNLLLLILLGYVEAGLTKPPCGSFTCEP